MPRCSILVQSAELAEVTQTGPVSGGEDDRVDRFALAVAPHHLATVERGEHRTPIDATLSQGLLEPDAVGHHAATRDLAQPDGRQCVEPGLAEPVVHVLAAQPLRDESHGMAAGDGDLREWRELVRDLRGGVTRTDDDDSLA